MMLDKLCFLNEIRNILTIIFVALALCRNFISPLIAQTNIENKSPVVSISGPTTVCLEEAEVIEYTAQATDSDGVIIFLIIEAIWGLSDVTGASFGGGLSDSTREIIHNSLGAARSRFIEPEINVTIKTTALDNDGLESSASIPVKITKCGESTIASACTKIISSSASSPRIVKIPSTLSISGPSILCVGEEGIYNFEINDTYGLHSWGLALLFPSGSVVNVASSGTPNNILGTSIKGSFSMQGPFTSYSPGTHTLILGSEDVFRNMPEIEIVDVEIVDCLEIQSTLPTITSSIPSSDIELEVGQDFSFKFTAEDLDEDIDRMWMQVWTDKDTSYPDNFVSRKVGYNTPYGHLTFIGFGKRLQSPSEILFPSSNPATSGIFRTDFDTPGTYYVRFAAHDSTSPNGVLVEEWIKVNVSSNLN